MWRSSISSFFAGISITLSCYILIDAGSTDSVKGLLQDDHPYFRILRGVYWDENGSSLAAAFDPFNQQFEDWFKGNPEKKLLVSSGG